MGEGSGGDTSRGDDSAVTACDVFLGVESGVFLPRNVATESLEGEDGRTNEDSGGANSSVSESENRESTGDSVMWMEGPEAMDVAMLVRWSSSVVDD
jgi:hypothetical protein